MRTSKANTFTRDGMSLAGNIPWTVCLKTTSEQRVEKAFALVGHAVDYVTVKSSNQGGTAGTFPAPFGAGVFVFCY